MATYKVLVVDDSPFMRKIVSDLIEADPAFQVIATATNGLEATRKVLELKPDAVTMDVEMPEMNGLEALKIIMSQRPLPVIMLSGINEQGMRETIMALESGAFDFIRKPSVSNSQDIDEVGQQLRRQLHTAMQVLERRRKRSEQKHVTPEQPQSVSAELDVQPQSPPQALQTPPVKPAPPAVSGKRPAEVAVKPISPPSSLSGRVSRPVKTEDIKKAKLDKLPTQTRPTLAGSDQRAPGRPVPVSPAELKQPKTPPVKPTAAPTSRTDTPLPSMPATPVGHTAHTDRPVTAISKLVAVGCSTGGPRALKSFLERIPANFPAPIVIVQHMPPNFTRSLAQRLNSLSQINVVEGEHGMPLQPGTAYIAPGGYHMTVVKSQGGYRLQLTQDPPRNGHRPSVDTLFASIRPFNDLQRYAVIMTGMGSDGAREMKNLYDSGVIPTFAESEDTCVVYGMPRSAVELGCVNHLLPLPEIAPKLVQIVR
ncbi:chemotaxis response regulator protein-glutamate methylesterase [Paenibacillus campi]|uniref:protein-glutamate methylesterase/protein-glutamine glutaminase n=1 Tax=Paenibacillus campi TaxID=3106031 RepID=UPI002AFDCBA3|nr:chemotaxis response regulator protein-glutamate methylesterase [Paenibacillus sp. SGZ-1014]